MGKYIMASVSFSSQTINTQEIVMTLLLCFCWAQALGFRLIYGALLVLLQFTDNDLLYYLSQTHIMMSESLPWPHTIVLMKSLSLCSRLYWFYSVLRIAVALLKSSVCSRGARVSTPVWTLGLSRIFSALCSSTLSLGSLARLIMAIRG